MSASSWIETLMPCLSRRKATGSHAVQNISKSLPARFEDGLELAQSISRPGSAPSTPVKRTGVTTTIIAELPSESSPRKLSRLRSTSSPARKPSGKKAAKGKRKRAQTITISAPTNFRRLDGEMPRLPQPTYPSPSRIRPGNLTMDTRDPSIEDEGRPQTAPLETTNQSRESFPFPSRSASLSTRTHHAWKLGPLPPMPSLDVQQKAVEESASDAANLKRKPVPVRTRAESEPISPTHKTFAAEMLGSVPSPVELEAPPNPISKPIVERESITSSKKGHSKIASFSSIGSPTLGRFSARLSIGALSILTSFPTTPRPSKSVTRPHRSQSQPRLRSNTTTTVDSSDMPMMPMMPKPLSPTKKQSSPRSISPRSVLPTAIDIQDLLQHDPSPFFNKSLPATPKSTTFDKSRFISLASGLEFDDFILPLTPGFDLDGDGKKTWIEGVERGSDAESIHIFLASSRAGSPKRSPALA